MTINNTTLKTTGATVLQALGLHHILRFVNRHKAAVLLYHSVMRDDETGVIPPWAIQESQFRWQMEYIARHYQVLSLPDYIERLMAGRPVPPHSLILTFDDGFRDNYTVAYPILKELGLPATIFVVTGYLDSDQALWPDVLFYAIYRTPVQFLDLRDLGDGAHYLRSLTERNAAFRRLIGYLKELTVEEKNHWLDEIARRLQLDLNWEADGEAPFALLRRQDIQHMAQEGLVTFGVHTETHEILTRFPFEQAQQEIRISKQKLEALLGTPARFFAYPNGTEQDFNDALKGELRQQGFTCAFASRGGLVNAHFDPFALARLGIGPEESRAYFKLKLSGAVHAVEQVKNWMVGS